MSPVARYMFQPPAMVTCCRTCVAQSRVDTVYRYPHKEEKMAAIHEALAKCMRKTPCFTKMSGYSSQPENRADWQLRGQQKRVVTPGQNENIILPVHCTAVRVKSAILVGK